MRFKAIHPIVTFSILIICNLLLGACSDHDNDDLQSSLQWQQTDVVKTNSGSVEATEGEDNTLVWKAIPYAEPPVGALRWKAPQAAKPWAGIRAETDFPDVCSQLDFTGSGAVVGGEDCLYLNIWRPDSPEKNLPVYVWLHGGGNSIGGGAQTEGYYGHSVANRSNMVFVSLNWRLGPLGWHAHPALRSGDDPLSDSGNFGTLDIIQSLQWIQDNIEAFGGDPDNVTITGESAGAMNVMSLLISPLAEGLFHKAISQSGGDISQTMAQAELSANEMLAKMRVNDGLAANLEEAAQQLTELSNDEIENYLRNAETEQLLAGYDTLAFGMLSLPTIFRDGEVVSASGLQTYQDGGYLNKVPTILGSNRDETKLFLFTESAFTIDGEFDEPFFSAVSRLSSDSYKVNAVDNPARALATYPDHPGIYAYEFLWGAAIGDKPSPLPGNFPLMLGACHSLDVPFFFNSDNFNEIMSSWVFTEENRAGRKALTSAMMRYAAALAYNGNPNENIEDLPHWKAWTENQPQVIMWDSNGDEFAISMSSSEMTFEDVRQRLQDSVSTEIFSRSLEFIENDVVTSAFAGSQNLLQD